MIYLLRAGTTDGYKVGYTRRSGEHRRLEMQGSNVERLHLVGSWPGSFEQEQRMHKLLDPWSAQGGKEWYRLNAPTLTEHILARGCRPPALNTRQDPIAQLLPVFVLSHSYERLPPQPREGLEVDAQIKQNIRDHYLDHGPWETDDGHILVGTGVRDLLTAGIVDCAVWVPYALAAFRLAWCFDVTELYGQVCCLEVFEEEGIVEQITGGWRLVPGCVDVSVVWEIVLSHEEAAW